MRNNWFHTIWIAILIGAVNGLIAALFLGFVNGAIYIVDIWQVPLYILPILGGMVLMLFKGRMLDDHVDFGIWAVKEELYYIDRQMMNVKDVSIKLIGTLLSIVSGFSVGRFSPMIYIGGAVGSQVGYSLNLAEDEIKLYIGCGVAATLSAVFQDPIFATIFVLEIFLHATYFDRIPAIMLSSLIAMEVTLFFLGPFSPFGILENYVAYEKNTYILASLLGVVTGALTYIYNNAILKVKEFHKRFDNMIAPVAGGLLIAAVGYIKPEVFEIYTDFFAHYLGDDVLISSVLLLFALKIIAIIISFGCGAIGGTFAPAMYIGLLIGVLGSSITGFESGAIIGMCGMFAGFANAPLAATIFFTTISGINEMVVPFFIVSIISASTYKMLDVKDGAL